MSHANKSDPPYGSFGHPMYGPAASSPSSMHGPAGYPKIGQQGHAGSLFPPPARNSPYHHPPSSSPSSSSSSGLGIKVTIKPEYRITPPPQMLPRLGDAPWSIFQYDFGLERKVLAEADKESQDWSKFGTETLPTKAPDSISSSQRPDPVMMRYIASGLNREAVSIAVANYGDNPTKVEEFVKGFTLLREMGFLTSSVAEALFMFENDTDKALANLLHGSS
ncbi:PREDICTED: uncharacterized protein LOC104811935 isoform X2 [Tarenaya hassleriana]|uniref:uncharacterized protein LOC104811935 isoform X2 n=1 Tax=Tarenaya hassleriana TaxID=28532 RepID=UPI00053C911C|nr:PREDICTED: uncharacterized protein LOC104811935 isoform X2 [Tarenaya hassleriana]